MKEGYAAVNIKAKYGEKKFVSTKCVFENVGTNKMEHFAFIKLT
ncbi:hypothetical protein ACT3S9_07145 [Pseudoalteromonas sp. AOP31-A2-14]